MPPLYRPSLSLLFFLLIISCTIYPTIQPTKTGTQEEIETGDEATVSEEESLPDISTLTSVAAQEPKGVHVGLLTINFIPLTASLVVASLFWINKSKIRSKQVELHNSIRTRWLLNPKRFKESKKKIGKVLDHFESPLANHPVITTLVIAGVTYLVVDASLRQKKSIIWLVIQLIRKKLFL